MSWRETEATDVLVRLGVEHGTLADDERAALDHDGYVVLVGALDDSSVAEMRSAIDELLETARRDPTKKHGGTLHLDDILDAGAMFDRACQATARKRSTPTTFPSARAILFASRR